MIHVNPHSALWLSCSTKKGAVYLLPTLLSFAFGWHNGTKNILWVILTIIKRLYDTQQAPSQIPQPQVAIGADLGSYISEDGIKIFDMQAN